MQLYRYFVSQSREFCRHNTFVAYQRVYIVVVHFIIDSVPKIMYTPSYIPKYLFVTGTWQSYMLIIFKDNLCDTTAKLTEV